MKFQHKSLNYKVKQYILISIKSLKICGIKQNRPSSEMSRLFGS